MNSDRRRGFDLWTFAQFRDPLRLPRHWEEHMRWSWRQRGRESVYYIYISKLFYIYNILCTSFTYILRIVCIIWYFFGHVWSAFCPTSWLSQPGPEFVWRELWGLCSLVPWQRGGNWCFFSESFLGYFELMATEKRQLFFCFCNHLDDDLARIWVKLCNYPCKSITCLVWYVSRTSAGSRTNDGVAQSSRKGAKVLCTILEGLELSSTRGVGFPSQTHS